MATFVSDSFTDTNATALENHTGETGASWAVHPARSASVVIQSNRAQMTSSAAIALYLASGAPSGVEYDVSAAIRYSSPGSTTYRGTEVCGRLDATAETCYAAEMAFEPGWGTDVLTTRLNKYVSGTWTLLGSANFTGTLNATYTTKLEITDATKKVYRDGVEILSSADNTITSAGRVGIRMRNNTGATAMDSFLAEEAGSTPINHDLDDADAQAIGSTETATLAASLTATDSQSLATTEAATLASSLSTTDSQSITSSETAILATSAVTSDSQAVTSAETATLAATVTATDAQAVGSAETAALAVTLTTSDTQAVGSSESAALTVTLAPADTQGIASSETAVVAASLTGADSQAVASTETAQIASVLASADAQAIATTETAILSGAYAATDTQVIVCTETATLVIQLVSADAQAIGSTETAQLRGSADMVPSFTFTAPPRLTALTAPERQSALHAPVRIRSFTAPVGVRGDD